MSYIPPQWVFILCLGHLLYSQHQDVGRMFLFVSEQTSAVFIWPTFLFLFPANSTLICLWKWKWKSLSRVQLCNPMDYTVHGILQARILEWVAFPFSRGSSQPRDQTQVSHSACAFFTSWATREAQEYWSGRPMPFARDLLDPRIELGFSTLQKDSLPTEPQGKPKFLLEYSWFTRLY